MHKKWMLALVLCGNAGCGIPKEQYDAKALEAHQLSQKYKDEEGKSAALEAKVKQLQQKNDELRGATIQHQARRGEG